VAARSARAAVGDAFEERYVLPLLERTQHNVCKAARLAGIDRNYLYRMMKKHGIASKE
jgi:transcriptional regulator of acetoin/glycerol metabolism